MILCAEKVCNILIKYGFKRVIIKSSTDTSTDHFENYAPHQLINFQKNDTGNYIYTRITQNNLKNCFKSSNIDFDKVNAELLKCEISNQ